MIKKCPKCQFEQHYQERLGMPSHAKDCPWKNKILL